MPTFGIISEGPTDQIVLENILCGFYNNADLNESIRFLQPFRDETDKYGTAPAAGWVNVFEYCKSQRLLEAFEQNDFIILQIDTDCCEDRNYDVKRTNAEGKNHTPTELIDKVIERFQQIFNDAFPEQYALFENRIIYAVCVEEIECWLLPLYYDDKIQSATNNCVNKLNDKIYGKFGFYIDGSNKSNMGNQYNKLSKGYLKHKILMGKCEENESLKVFAKGLKEKNIITE